MTVLDAAPLRLTSAPSVPDAAGALELLLFSVDPVLVAEATAGGMDGVIVDWELRGKERRQAGEGTEINRHTLEDLRAVRAATSARVLCRLNGFGPWTPGEVELALDAGADELLLPMVRDPHEVDATLRAVRGRCGLGILVETQDGVAHADELAQRPLSRVYVGLNDLRIDRRSTSLFAPLADGTVEHVRECVGDIPFGVAGLTLPDCGSPVPSRLIAAELVRLRASFTFLRRSFLADTAGRPLAPAVASIDAFTERLTQRDERQVRADREALLQVVPGDAVRTAA